MMDYLGAQQENHTRRAASLTERFYKSASGNACLVSGGNLSPHTNGSVVLWRIERRHLALGPSDPNYASLLVVGYV